MTPHRTPLRFASVLLASLVLSLFACGREDDSETDPDRMRGVQEAPTVELEPGCGEPGDDAGTDAGVDAGTGTEPDAGPAVCGDALKHPSEECDDGNNDLGDGCTPLCTREPVCSNGVCENVCGDGQLRSEQCDDGNTLANDGCSPTCEFEPGFICMAVDDLPPAQLSLPIVYRDFRGYDLLATGSLPRGHIDFENALGSEKGIVATTLDAQGKPVYAKTSMASATTHGKAAFDQWFRDVPNVNQTVIGTLNLPRQAIGQYLFDDQTFFPLDTAGWVASGHEPLRADNSSPAQLHNFNFTSETRYWFEYRGDEVLTFRGDDDVWVFINGILAVDLGGIHAAETASLTLSQRASQLGLIVGGTYQLAVFQAERHTRASSYRLGLNNFFRPSRRTQCVPGPDPEPLCGNGTTDPGEQCDDGINDGGYSQCAPGCVRGPRCGDGIVHLVEGEQCDDGNLRSLDGCNATCQLELP
ncbi:fibro-slime domain-containing protein [Myxococcus sp. CA056]|uniref:fibro-slime domain-containing protein n=1 Tax=Myxococcus sp. CA056 TaxID=2741740 RepID=UPI00157BB0F3|nr:fibro-slime domain-containing protein [Myxococcus sp. CA056]NTX11575.1 fibro-slime domain-containing protein [Myxococcus sp. CA056]